MNWYKKSQLLEDDIKMEDRRFIQDAKHDGYSSIAHSYEKDSPIYLWILKDEEIDIEEVTEKGMCHGDVEKWDDIRTGFVYGGRYESSTGVLSLSTPYDIQRFKPIPSFIIDKLKQTFTNIKSISVFAKNNKDIKKSQTDSPIDIYSYNKTDEELKILFKNKGPYTYYNVNPDMYNKIKYLINKKNYHAVNKILRNISKNTPYTEKEKEEMLNQLYEEGYLS